MQRLLASRWTTLGLLAALILAIGLILPSSYYHRVGALVMISALAAIGLNLLLEALGQWPAATQDLAHYLARTPRAPDRLALGQMLERLQQSGKPPLH